MESETRSIEGLFWVRAGQFMAILMVSLGMGQVALAYLAASGGTFAQAVLASELDLDGVVRAGLIAIALGTLFGLLTELSRSVGRTRTGTGR